MLSGAQVRRRRECLSCGVRYTTYERAELLLPQVIKRDGSRTAFDETKLQAGMKRALHKRRVSTEQVDAIVADIKQRLRASGEREVASEQLGRWVMQELRKLDEVAYVRFASVYHRFDDIRQFREAIEKLHTSLEQGVLAE